ncbi:TVP38/TMEM64 family protein [Paenibacillus albiflavus]
MDIKSLFTEENIQLILDQYRSFGPLPGIFITFLKSFVPPLPTIVIVGANAAAYGLWLGFLYSLIGIVSGCMTVYLIVRKISTHRMIQRWAQKPKVQKRMEWMRKNAFNYVFILSIFPVGPFAVINLAAALVLMPFRSFMIAIIFGKAIMVFMVSFIGYDIKQFIESPLKLLYVLIFALISWYVCRKVEAWITKPASIAGEESTSRSV